MKLKSLQKNQSHLTPTDHITKKHFLDEENELDFKISTVLRIQKCKVDIWLVEVFGILQSEITLLSAR